ncbi:hypothetical protein FH972_024438 [Carpinus fangiana]|uniref:DNA (cytosine-5)-methyltransferase 1 replication foci domain-containing protein n=1 Tax=Carpinus fangiana TaxID=176857 RepID=A0A5N6KYI8_9ROSI|nr:hypothetical protein FH972_024438 [Carpinus fangiana]
MSKKTTIPERSLLKPLPASVTDENLWPIFTLKDAEVYTLDHRGRHTPIELWRAEPTHPIVVEGTLMRLPRSAQKHYASSVGITGDGPAPQRIKIDSCTNWSYGQYEDGAIAFWAAGEAGWFEVKPAAWYKPSYKRTRQGIEILYFIADFYREGLRRAGASAAKRRTSLGQMPLERLFTEYGKEPKHKCAGDGDGSAAAAKKQFLEHADLLATLMKRGKEAAGWKWEDVPVFEWLAESMNADSTDHAAESNEDDDDMSTSTSSDLRPRVSGKGKSSLRPKGTHRGRTRSSTLISDDDTEMVDAETSPNALKRNASTAVPRSRPGRPPKRLSMSRTSISKGQLPSPPSDSASSEDPASSRPVPLPIHPGLVARHPKPSAHHPPALTLTTNPLPSYDPAPGTDTWHCPMDGCSTQYYGVTSQPGVKEMIRQHYAGHAVEAQRQIDLIFQEERPYLPVGNLVRHIRGLAQADQAERVRNGQTEANQDEHKPKPIRQRY